MAAEAGPISKVLIVVAMQAEAMPLVNKFKLVEAPAHESTFLSMAALGSLILLLLPSFT